MEENLNDYECFDDADEIEEIEEEEDFSANYFTVIKDRTINPNSNLDEVIGLEEQKKELLNVISWFKNSQYYHDKGVSIPKGVILFGVPGNGKSLLIRKLLEMVDVPVIIYKGGDALNSTYLNKAFAKARELKKAIIVIDELDLMINKDRRIVRALQENLDGVETNDDILILTATNDLDEIPDALKRNGRLEKLIHVPYPEGKDAVSLLKRNFEKFKVQLPTDLDEDELALSLHRVTCAGINAIVNDVVLRNGFENITSVMIDNSINNITERVKHSHRNESLDVAIHEASHAIMANKFKEFFYVNKLNIDGASGCFAVKEVNEEQITYGKIIANIQIDMAGLIGQKLLCDDASLGADYDLEDARKCAYNLFNKSGYSSCWETLPNLSNSCRTDTPKKRRHNERKIEKFLRKQEKIVYKYLSKHISDIVKLGNLLFEKKHLKSTEILDCLNS